MKSTFKKSLFFAAWCVAFIFGTVAFYSCSNEDLDEDSVQSKAELFRAKAKELSKKYGVDVTLNEENIEKMAETMTMEQFEKEFQMFATMKIDTVLVGESNEGMPKKLRFKTRKRMTESQEEPNRDKVYSGSFKICNKHIAFHYEKDGEKCYSNYEVASTVDWSYQQTGTFSVNVSLELDGYPDAKGGGKLTFAAFVNNSGTISFNANGNINISSEYFSRNVGCDVNHNEVNSITFSEAY